VAFRPIVDRGDERLGRLRFAVRFHQPRHVVAPESCKRHLVEALGACQLGKGGGEGLRRCSIAVASRGNHQQMRVGEVSRDEPQQEQRRRVRDLDVLEDNDERPRCCRVAQERRDRLEEAKARAFRIESRRRWEV
jgi:hypothetical protein